MDDPNAASDRAAEKTIAALIEYPAFRHAWDEIDEDERAQILGQLTGITFQAILKCVLLPSEGLGR